MFPGLHIKFCTFSFLFFYFRFASKTLKLTIYIESSDHTKFEFLLRTFILFKLTVVKQSSQYFLGMCVFFLVQKVGNAGISIVFIVENKSALRRVGTTKGMILLTLSLEG